MRKNRKRTKKEMLMREVIYAIASTNLTEWELEKLADLYLWDDIKAVLERRAKITVKHHIINSVQKFNLGYVSGHKLHAHDWYGKVIWNPKNITLHQDIHASNGEEALEMLHFKNLLTGHFAGYLVRHPEIIPTDWEDKEILFGGTIFSWFTDEDRWVYCLFFDEKYKKWRCKVTDLKKPLKPNQYFISLNKRP